MKVKLLLLITILISSCKSKILKSDMPIATGSYNQCIQLDQEFNKLSVRAKAKQEKILYYYNLNEFLSLPNRKVCDKHSALIKDIQTFSGFITKRAAVSVNRFQIEAKVDFYDSASLLDERVYKTEVDSDELVFLTSGSKKQNNKDSAALTKGLQNILDQINNDLSNLDEKLKK